MNVSVWGNGGLAGLAAAIGMATIGHTTIYCDHDVQLMRYLKFGIAPHGETGMQEALDSALKLKRLSFAHDPVKAIAGADAVIVAGTEPGFACGPNLPGFVATIADTVAKGVIASKKKRYKVLILQCQCPLGTHEAFQARLLERLGDEIKYMDVVSNPVMVTPGNSLPEFLMPDKIIIGTYRKKAVTVMEHLCRSLKSKTLVMDPRSVEIAHMARYVYAASKMSILGEIAEICMDNGADMKKVARCLDFGGKKERDSLIHGMGFDTAVTGMAIKSLAETAGASKIKATILESLSTRKAERIRAVADRLEYVVGSLDGKTIAVFGSRHPVSEAKENIAAFAELAKRSGATVKAWIPDYDWKKEKDSPPEMFVEKPGEATRDANCILILGDSAKFGKLALGVLGSRMKNQVIFDVCHSIRAKTALTAGFQYHAFGISSKRIPWWIGKKKTSGKKDACLRDAIAITDDKVS